MVSINKSTKAKLLSPYTAKYINMPMFHAIMTLNIRRGGPFAQDLLLYLTFLRSLTLRKGLTFRFALRFALWLTLKLTFGFVLVDFLSLGERAI